MASRSIATDAGYRVIAVDTSLAALAALGVVRRLAGIAVTATLACDIAAPSAAKVC